MYIGNYYFNFPAKPIALTPMSWAFVLFLLVSFAIYWLLPKKCRVYVLAILSLIFVTSFSIFDLGFSLCFALLVYGLGWFVSKHHKTISLAVCLIVVIEVLVCFKYSNEIGLGILRPLGLSFVSFKAISYIVDAYKGEKISNNPFYTLAYLLFFPTITAGPIHRYHQFKANLNDASFDYLRARDGGLRFVLGVFEKMVICDFVGSIVARASLLNGANLLFSIFLYSLQIYLDFDSYSNIAIGCASMFGIETGENFKVPYLSINLQSFWRKWHISLSSFFRDYVYIPLGGNRKGKFRRYLNTIIVFVLSGVWHGSTLNYLFWGLLHGLFSALENIIASFIHLSKNKILRLIEELALGIFNFLLVSFLWLFFRYVSFNEVIDVIKRLIIHETFSFTAIGLTNNEVIWFITLMVIYVISELLRKYLDLKALYHKMPFIIRWLFYILLAFIFMIFAVYGSGHAAGDFIYQWF